jgi:hypothetical protein
VILLLIIPLLIFLALYLYYNRTGSNVAPSTERKEDVIPRPGAWEGINSKPPYYVYQEEGTHVAYKDSEMYMMIEEAIKKWRK